MPSSSVGFQSYFITSNDANNITKLNEFSKYVTFIIATRNISSLTKKVNELWDTHYFHYIIYTLEA